MTEYTPSSQEVKSMYEEGKLAKKGSYEELEFDRWITQHDEEIRQQVIDQLAAKVDDVDR